MKVEPIPGEPARFFVSSDSRADMVHIVDTDYREEKWSKPRTVCSCEQSFAKGLPCKHAKMVADYVNQNKTT